MSGSNALPAKEPKKGVKVEDRGEMRKRAIQVKDNGSEDTLLGHRMKGVKVESCNEIKYQDEKGESQA